MGNRLIAWDSNPAAKRTTRPRSGQRCGRIRREVVGHDGCSDIGGWLRSPRRLAICRARQATSRRFTFVFAFDRVARLWQWRAEPIFRNLDGEKCGQTRMGHQADLSDLRDPLLRSVARAGDLSEMRHALRPRGVFEIAPCTPRGTGREGARTCGGRRARYRYRDRGGRRRRGGRGGGSARGGRRGGRGAARGCIRAWRRRGRYGRGDRERRGRGALRRLRTRPDAAIFRLPRSLGLPTLAKRISCGAIAQLGERYNGIVEVTGSIPVGSTKQNKGLVGYGWALLVSGGSMGEAGGRQQRGRISHSALSRAILPDLEDAAADNAGPGHSGHAYARDRRNSRFGSSRKQHPPRAGS